MAESFQEKRRRELGLSGASDFQTQRMMDLGMIPDTRPKAATEQKPAMSPEMQSFTNKTVTQSRDSMMGSIDRFKPTEMPEMKQRPLYIADDAGKDMSQDKSRNIPILGPLVKGMDWIADKTLGATEFLGQFITPGASVANVGGFAGAVGAGATKVLPKLAGSSIGNKIALEAVKEGALGAPLTAVHSAAQGDSNKEIVVQGAIGAGFGAGLGAAAPVIGAGLKKALGSLFTRTGNQEAVRATEQILALPEPRQRGNPNIATTPEVIYAGASPTRTRTTERFNPYRQKYENLIAAAKERQFTPGRELEELESMWSQMADRNDPNLDKLIDLAYPKAKVPTAEGLQRGRMKEVSGLGPNLERNLNPPKFELPLNTENIKQSTNVTPEIPAILREGPPIRTGSDIDPLGISPFAKNTDYGFKNPKDTRSHIVSKTKGERLGFTERVKRLYEKSNDNLQRINSFDKYVEQVTGRKLSASERAYYLALNQRGADVISHSILTESLVDAQGNVVGKSLKDITKNIPKRRMVDFEDYLIAKHAETRMSRGETVYAKQAEMTPEKVAQKIAEYESRYPEYQQIANEMYDFSNKLGEAWLVDTGIISRETWQQWRTENPFWIPMKRDFKDIEKKSGGQAKRAFANQNAPVKAYSETGSERKIVSPIESMIEYVDSFVKTAKRNEVMQSVIRSLDENPQALKDFAELVGGQADDVATLIRGEDGLEQVLSIINEGFEKATIKKPDLTKGNVVSALVGGKRQYVKVNDPAFLEALTNLSPQAHNAIIAATGKLTNIMKLLTTGVNPVFSITRNIFYDIPQAFAFSKTTNNPIRFAWDLLDGVISTFGNRDLYRAYKAMGGGHSSSVAADRNLLAQSKLSIMPQRQKASLIRKAYAGLENLANIIESAPRLGEFKRITKDGGNSYDSRIKGLFEAQDVTTNFKRYGSVAKQADAIFPYLNAAIQGLDKIVRTFKDNPAQATIKSFAAVTIPTLALYAINYDNPKYKKLSNYTKDRFFLIPTTSEEYPFIKIPKPREIGIPFGALFERSLRLMAEEDPEAFRGFADQVRIAFAPPGISATVEDLQKGQIPNPFKDTIYGPLGELESNKNFAGAPIVPGYLEGVSPRYQYDANTSDLSKKIGDVLNVSPKQIDHLIRSYGGVIGQIGIPATTQGSSVMDTLKKQVTADPVFSTDASTYLYDLKDKLDRQYKDIQTTGKIPDGYNDAARKYLGNVASTMSDITKRIRLVDDSDMTSAEKKDKKRELTELRNELAREAYQRVTEALK